MISQLFMAKSALFAYQRKMQIVSNNISNAQTVGYKRRELQLESIFPLVLSSNITDSDDVVNAPSGKRKRYTEYGQGVRIAEISKDFNQGTIEITNQPLDLAVDGDGFFQFKLPDGQTAYSRAGNLHLDYEGNVVNPNGQPLEPAITIPADASEIIVNEQGQVYVLTPDEPTPQEIGQIYLAKFRNNEGLRDIGQNLYLETAASGDPSFETPTENGTGTVHQRALEYSNVNVIEEMFNMIITQRSFEIIVKAIQTGDAILKSGSDLKG